ncbi:MAG: MnmA/TRMU family protein [bacterium]
MSFIKINKKTVAVAMSGGVDSSVSAIILKKRGFNVIGLSMRLIGDLHNKGLNEEPIEKSCCSISDIIDAKRVCVKLSIPHFVINLEDEFKENVIDKFTQEYLEGKTPNPCILCNKILKFDILLKRAAQLGADYLATGHYARITKKLNGGFNLIKAKDPLKDQSYVLYNLNQESLSRLIFPVGNLYKTDIRKIALDNGFNEISKKKDSVEICFIPDGNYHKFILNQLQQADDNDNTGKYDNESCSGTFLNLKEETNKSSHNSNNGNDNNIISNNNYTNNNIINNSNINNNQNKVLITENDYKGYIKNMEGEIIGKHNGIFQYTVGQRKRLGIASAQPLYVVKIDPAAKDIFVGTMNDCYSDELYINYFNFIDIKYKNKLSEPGLTAKIRYSSLNYKCSAEIINNEIPDTINGDKNNNHIIKLKVKLKIKFKEPIKFITPGQSAVLYSGLKVIGGGIIEI